jgi:hypothetical protein
MRSTKIWNPGVGEYGDSDYLMPRQVPETAMDREILRRVIASERPETGLLVMSIVTREDGSDDWDDDGWLAVSFARRDTRTDPLAGQVIDLDALLIESLTVRDAPVIRGRCCVAEREYPRSEASRVVVIWETQPHSATGGTVQSNEMPYLPVTLWQLGVSNAA